jgi:hypothetical protein
MSFLDKIFPSSTQQQAAPQPAPAAAAPVENPTPAAPAAQPDPFETLWQNDDKQGSQGGINFNLDPAQLAEIAGKIDYSQAVTPEIRQRLAMGGEDAVAATMEALNAVNRMSYQQNAVATTKLIEAAVKSTEASMDEKIQRTIKSMGLAENVTATNPALSNPAFAPIVKAAQQQIIAKFPNASQADLNKMLNQYLEKAGEAFNPGMMKKANAPAGYSNTIANTQQEQDWAAWLSTEFPS